MPNGDRTGLIFDEDAQAYQRARPGYPEALIDDLMARTGLHRGERVIEIGPGTGQATRALTARGFSVVAIEPGQRLADVLRETVPGDVAVVATTFEDFSAPGGPVAAVMAFTSWHWLAAPARAANAAACLRPGGVLVTVTTHHVYGGTTGFFHQAQACYERWDPATRPGIRLNPAHAIPVLRDEIDDDDAFDVPIHLRHEAEIAYTTREYIDLLGTYSGHRALDPRLRHGLLDCLRQLIDTHYAGHIVKRYLYGARIARRR